MSSGMLPSQKRCLTIKSAEGVRSMEFFLNEILAHEVETASGNCETFAAIRHSPMLAKAMLRCHERFVRIVASELVRKSTSVNDTKETSETVQRAGENHVQIALKELGMHDIYSEMKQTQQSVRSAANRTEIPALPTKRRRKNERRVKQWTEEEIVEQELLLASSKEKFLSGGS
jgi:hypothetical protein